MLPEAEVFTSVYDAETWDETLAGRVVHASFLDRLPGARRGYSKLLPLMNAAFESFDLSDFDLVVSSSHSCAKNVLTRPDTLHVCYCHTPMRHAWEPRFLDNEPLSRPAAFVARLLLGRLRRHDLAGASRPDAVHRQLQARRRPGSRSTIAGMRASSTRPSTSTCICAARATLATTTWCSDASCRTSASTSPWQRARC